MSYLSVNPYVLNLVPLFNVADPTNGGTNTELGTGLSNIQTLLNTATNTLSIGVIQPVPPAETVVVAGNMDVIGTLTVGGVEVGANADGSNFIYGSNVTISTGTTNFVMSNSSVSSINAFSFIVGGNDVFSIDGLGRALYQGDGVSSNINRLWVSSSIFYADRAAFGFNGTSNLSTSFDVWSGEAYFNSNVHVKNNVYANSFVNFSDRRLKENIRPLEGSLSTVCALQGVHYTMGGEPTIGFIAQEVREVVPEAVHETPGGLLAVDYDRIIPLLVEAVKELACVKRD
jgi:hypothetical protein